MKPKDLLNKRIVVDDTIRSRPEPNPKLLKKIQSRSMKWMTREEQIARRIYLDELREREKYNDV